MENNTANNKFLVQKLIKFIIMAILFLSKVYKKINIGSVLFQGLFLVYVVALKYCWTIMHKIVQLIDYY